MKVCYICSEYPPGPHGGIGTFTAVTARGLIEAGHDVRVVGVYPPKSIVAGSEFDNGVKVSRSRTHGGMLGWILDRVAVYNAIRVWIKGGGRRYCRDI